MNAKITNRLIFILSILGLAVSSFLAYEYSLTGPISCPVGGGCDVVRASIYSHFLGIAIPYWGIAFYLTIASLVIFRSQNLTNINLAKLLLILSLGGFGFGVYLTYLEGFIIGAYCFWCVTSFIISGAILLLSFLALSKGKIDEHRD